MRKKNEKELLKRHLTGIRQALKGEEKKVEKQKAKEAAKNVEKNIVEAEPEASKLKNLGQELAKAVQHGASMTINLVNSNLYFYNDGAEAEK